ncbi:MAG: FtsX-like permease family protein [Bdellovibrionaceae bacterium]|nr:FtsX-like permease family protein [Bdellovibrionales bacterium]MCB9085048.1 FtsX-like permease family protein [Pseudobdellovibrionaceae bacterium]
MVKYLDIKLVRDLLHMKAQVVTIALVVACGVAVLAGMLSTYESLLLAQSSFYNYSRFGHIFAEIKRAPKSLASRIQNLPGVSQVEERLVFDLLLDMEGRDEPAVGRFLSLPRGQQSSLNRIQVLKGRWPLPEQDNEVLVGQAFFDFNKLELNQEISAMFNGRYRKLRVVGVAVSPEYVYALPGSSPLPDDAHFGVFWIRRDSLAASFDMEGAFNSLSLTVLPGANEKAIVKTIDRWFLPYGGVGSYTRKQQISNMFLTEEIRGLKVQATIIPIVFLCVAAFLLNVVIGRIINSQREQIATLKALGFADKQIAGHYLKLSLVIIALGLIFGIAGGYWLAESMTQLYTQFFRFPVLVQTMPAYIPLLSIALSGGSALIGVAQSLYGIFKMPPAEAMRPALPAEYHSSWVELSGIPNKLSNEGRMILRGLSLRPLRSLVSALGISFALVIIILGMFWSDAIDYLMHVQFSLIQKEDASVSFTKPLPIKSLYELQNLPGVIHAEGLRAVPVRIYHGPKTETTALFGVGPISHLKAILDTDLKPIDIPRDGLVMSQTLARKLKIKAQDRISIEVLEGRRPKGVFPIAGVVDDFLGQFLYTRNESLHRLMKEGPKINSVLLKTDSEQSQRLYTELKNYPSISSVTFKTAALKTFNETTAKFMLVFATILTVFSVIIAFGIVYNSARIALSERSWEFASLRVLGFTSGEVFRMLMGEILILCVAALPLGWVLGYYLTRAIIDYMAPDELAIPMKIEMSTFTWSGLTLAVSAVVSAWVLWLKIRNLDFNEALKTRG